MRQLVCSVFHSSYEIIKCQYLLTNIRIPWQRYRHVPIFFFTSSLAVTDFFQDQSDAIFEKS